MHSAVDAPAACAVYRRRRPERTPLYQSVQGHLETYLALAREGHTDEDGVPQYVEREFRRYLECGILAHGFARARCGACGHDFLIAFSCKGRAVCPSCTPAPAGQPNTRLSPPAHRDTWNSYPSDGFLHGEKNRKKARRQMR